MSSNNSYPWTVENATHLVDRVLNRGNREGPYRNAADREGQSG